MLGAVSGMKESLEELISQAEDEHRSTRGAARAARAGDDDGGGGGGDGASKKSMSAKRRRELLLAEVARYKEVLAHPAFKADPWGALMEHIRNTVTIPAERRRAEEEAAAKEDERRAKKKKGKQRAAAAEARRPRRPPLYLVLHGVHLQQPCVGVLL